MAVRTEKVNFEVRTVFCIFVTDICAQECEDSFKNRGIFPICTLLPVFSLSLTKFLYLVLPENPIFAK